MSASISNLATVFVWVIYQFMKTGQKKPASENTLTPWKDWEEKKCHYWSALHKMYTTFASNSLPSVL